MDRSKTRAVISYIESHSSENLPLKKLAEIAGYNVDYFAETFRKETGLSVHDYIRRYKITLAAFDLLSGLSCGEAAAKYGFMTASGFSKAFRKCYDMSPREYKATYELNPSPTFLSLPDLQAICYLFLPPSKDFSLNEGGAYWWKKDFNDYVPEEWEQVKIAGIGDIGGWIHSEDGMKYAFGPIVSDVSVVPKDMQVINIPAAEYAVFKAPRSVLNSELHKNVVTLWVSLYENWFANGKIASNTSRLFFELYHDKDTYIYVPIVAHEQL